MKKQSRLFLQIIKLILNLMILMLLPQLLKTDGRKILTIHLQRNQLYIAILMINPLSSMAV